MFRCNYCGTANFSSTNPAKTKCSSCKKILEPKPYKFNEKSINLGGTLTPKRPQSDDEPWDQ